MQLPFRANANRTAFYTLPSHLAAQGQEQHQQQQQAQPVSDGVYDPFRFQAPTVSRYFAGGMRVYAAQPQQLPLALQMVGSSGVAHGAAVAQPAPDPPLKTLLFGSHAATRLKILMHFAGKCPTPSDPYLFPVPKLQDLFRVQQSSSVKCDLLLPGMKSRAFVWVTGRELQTDRQQKELVQR
jgi:hypothetical protein